MSDGALERTVSPVQMASLAEFPPGAPVLASLTMTTELLHRAVRPRVVLTYDPMRMVYVLSVVDAGPMGDPSNTSEGEAR